MGLSTLTTEQIIPELMAAVIQRQDLAVWVATREISVARWRERAMQQ